MVPHARGLLQAVERLDQLTNPPRSILVPRRLQHVHLSIKVTVQECVLDVELSEMQTATCSNGEEHASGSVVRHRGKGLTEVFSSNLCETPGHQACLAPLEASIRLRFHTKDPLHSHRPFPRGKLH